MNKIHLLPILILATAAGICFSLHSTAQTNTRNSKSRAADVTLDRLALLRSDLNTSGDTNTMALVLNLLSAKDSLQHTADVSMSVVLLERLRSGRTNEAIEFLEIRLTGALEGVGFYAEEIGEAQLRALKLAKDYGGKYPKRSPSPEIEKAVKKAFELLEKKR